MAEKVALLLGATGLVGSELLQLLLDGTDYHKVVVLARRYLPLKHPKLDWRVVDFDRLDDAAGAFAGVDDLFCCLGTTIKKAGSQAAFRRVDLEYPLAAARLAREAGVRQYLIVTAMGAARSSRFFYNRVKGEVEAELQALGLPGLHIFRPSLLLGSRREFRPGEQVAAVLGQVLSPLLLGPLRPYRPISGRTVALAMYAVARRGRTGTYIYPSDHIADIALGLR
jgi:uncharacterized protein YbjT (DUF2867 family)